MTDRPQPYTPPDFIKGRTAVLENRINAAFAAAFQPGDAAAQLVLDYLVSITLQDVLGPGSPDAALRHREGQRDLVRIIRTRVEDGRKNLPIVAVIEGSKQ